MNIYFLNTRDGNLISSRLVIKSVDNDINQGVFYCNMFTVLNWCPISLLVRETSPIHHYGNFFLVIGIILINSISEPFCFIISFGFFFVFHSLLCHFFVYWIV